jgi:hypothetical protein
MDNDEELFKMQAFQARTSFILGRAHGGIMQILLFRIGDPYEQLAKLDEILSKEINELYYNQPSVAPIRLDSPE